MQEIKGPSLTFKVPQAMFDRVDIVAKRHGLKRNQAIRLILEIGLDTYETTAAIGIPQLGEFVKKNRKALEERIQPKLI